MKKICANNILLILWGAILILYFSMEDNLVTLLLDNNDKTTDIGSADKAGYIKNQYKLVLTSVVISIGVLILMARSKIEYKDNRKLLALYDVVLLIILGFLAGSWLYEALVTYPKIYGI